MPRRLLRAVPILVLVIATAAHAERVEPPLELLYAENNNLVAGSLIEINPTGRLVFERKDVLSGKVKPPEHIDVRVPKSALGTVKVGERYIFGFSMLGADPRHPMRLAANPDGAQMLVSTGLDPALFRDTAETRAILKLGRSEHGRESGRLFDLLMKVLQGPDPALQRLAAGEIVLEREIGERLREDDSAKTIETVARNVKTAPDIRVTLLVAAAARPKDLGDWWQSLATDVVTNTPLDGYSDTAGDPTDLVLTALELLDQHAVKLAPDALKRWVKSPHPPLVERASVMLRRQSPALERSAIQEALADPKLPEPTRKFLSDHLRRLDRLDARSKARKDGSG
ncbi:MAG TPA: hypothetical protein VJ696_13560 [Rhodanobacteraceae bacterium]|nr:hypothetical protein [Rhodanobacteraceae bacterium]